MLCACRRKILQRVDGRISFRKYQKYDNLIIIVSLSYMHCHIEHLLLIDCIFTELQLNVIFFAPLIGRASLQLNCFILTCDDLDINECGTDNGGCSSAARCTNTVDSFICTCLPGYSKDGFTCEGKSDRNSDVLTS